jgi:hypothetical protein
VFRSRRRAVVLPQRDHARFSAEIAGAWSDALAVVRLDGARYARGVAELDGTAAEVRYVVDGQGVVTLEPWPLAVDRLEGAVRGFAGAGYPGDLRRVSTRYVLEPAGESR